MGTIEKTVEQLSIEKNNQREENFDWSWYHVLPFAAAAFYIFVPVLIWQLGIPSALKTIGDLLVIVMIGLAVVRMFTIDRIPGAFLVIIALTVIGVLMATFEGQDPAVTILGWWMMFRFPMVGLYVYLVPNWPKSIAGWLPKALVWLLGLQVIVQIALYLIGVRDFDNLAGTFGIKGSGPLLYFILIVLAFALAKWLVSGDWTLLAATLILGSFSSAMAEIKIFVIVAPLMAVVTLGIHILRGGIARRMVLYILFFVIAGTSFYAAYNIFIVDALGVTPLETFLESDDRDAYLGHIWTVNDIWQLGRNAEAEYGWKLIQKDGASLLFGYGLGTRQHSPELGLIGIGTRQSVYGLYVGRTLLVLMYEMGIIIFSVLSIFIILSISYLYRASRRDPTDDAMNTIRFGVLLYTLFWPIWIWYGAVWIMPAPSIIYWIIWGYAMHFSVSYASQKWPADLLVGEQERADGTRSVPA